MKQPTNTRRFLTSLSILLALLPLASPGTLGQNAATSAATATNAPPSPVQPAPRTGAPAQRHEVLNQRAKDQAGNVDLIFVGDSITQGWEGAGKEVWNRYYSQRKALNLGVGGDWTQHVLWRLDNGNLEGVRPKAAVVMIGTNNSGKGRHAPPEILEGVVAVVRKLQDKVPGIKVLLLGVFPRGEKFNAQRGDLQQVNQALQKLDDGKAIFYLDFGHRLIEADGSISKEMMRDFLHLTPKGYAIWAESIEDKLAQLLGATRVIPQP